jgi:hypothetical protein
MQAIPPTGLIDGTQQLLGLSGDRPAFRTDLFSSTEEPMKYGLGWFPQLDVAHPRQKLGK